MLKYLFSRPSRGVTTEVPSEDRLEDTSEELVGVIESEKSQLNDDELQFSENWAHKICDLIIEKWRLLNGWIMDGLNSFAERVFSKIVTTEGFKVLCRRLLAEKLAEILSPWNFKDGESVRTWLLRLGCESFEKIKQDVLDLSVTQVSLMMWPSQPMRNGVQEVKPGVVLAIYALATYLNSDRFNKELIRLGFVLLQDLESVLSFIVLNSLNYLLDVLPSIRGLSLGVLRFFLEDDAHTACMIKSRHFNVQTRPHQNSLMTVITLKGETSVTDQLLSIVGFHLSHELYSKFGEVLILESYIPKVIPSLPWKPNLFFTTLFCDGGSEVVCKSTIVVHDGNSYLLLPHDAVDFASGLTPEQVNKGKNVSLTTNTVIHLVLKRGDKDLQISLNPTQRKLHSLPHDKTKFGYVYCFIEPNQIILLKSRFGGIKTFYVSSAINRQKIIESQPSRFCTAGNDGVYKEVEVQLRHKDGMTVLHNANTAKGDCGSVLTIGRNVAAVHVATFGDAGIGMLLLPPNVCDDIPSVQLESNIDLINILDEKAANDKSHFERIASVYKGPFCNKFSLSPPVDTPCILTRNDDGIYASIPMKPDYVYGEILAYNEVNNPKDFEWAENVKIVMRSIDDMMVGMFGYTRVNPNFKDLSFVADLLKLSATNGTPGRFPDLVGKSKKDFNTKKSLLPTLLDHRNLEIISQELLKVCSRRLAFPLRFHLKEEPYKVSKIQEGKLRSIITPDWALSMVILAAHLWKKGSTYATGDDALAFASMSGRLGSCVGIDTAIVARYRHRDESTSYDVSRWDKSIPKIVMKAIFDYAPCQTVIHHHLFDNAVYCVNGRLVGLKASIWPSGIPPTLWGNTVMHKAVLLKLPAHAVTLQGDDLLIKKAYESDALKAYEHFGLVVKKDDVTEFCGMLLNYVGEAKTLVLNIKMDKVMAKSAAKTLAPDPLVSDAIDAWQNHLNFVSSANIDDLWELVRNKRTYEILTLEAGSRKRTRFYSEEIEWFSDAFNTSDLSFRDFRAVMANEGNYEFMRKHYWSDDKFVQPQEDEEELFAQAYRENYEQEVREGVEGDWNPEGYKQEKAYKKKQQKSNV
jgi:hypothetical protein